MLKLVTNGKSIKELDATSWRKTFRKWAVKNAPDKVAKDKKAEATALFKIVNPLYEITQHRAMTFPLDVTQFNNYRRDFKSSRGIFKGY